MSEQVQKQKQTPAKKTDEVEEIPVVTDTKEELKDALDELLDEIDSVLEVNAEEFVRSYIQKGGE